LSHIVPEIDFLDVFNFNLFSLQIELRHELTNVQVIPKTNVVQLYIKTQEISKSFSFRNRFGRVLTLSTYPIEASTHFEQIQALF